MNRQELLNIQDLFLELTDEWQARNYEGGGWFEPLGKRGIFGGALTLWLMMLQGINGVSMSKVLSLLRAGAADVILRRNTSSRKARFKEISPNTGGFSRAKSRLPLVDVEDIAEVINKGLMERGEGDKKIKGYKIYAIDGTNFVVERSDSLVDSFPRRRNQHGELNHPELRAVFATELTSGVSTCPQFGAAKGENGKSEITLSSKVIEEIDDGALVIGDRAFGVFSVASHAVSHNKHVILRMREEYTRRFLKTVDVPNDKTIDLKVSWKQSKNDRLLSLDDQIDIKGRIIRTTLISKGFPPLTLFFFTTTDLSVDDILEIYKKRVNVEVDIRYLKYMFKMERVYSKTPDALQKELLIRLTSYNLVRRVIADAAKLSDLLPREISFSKAADYTKIFGNKIIEANSEQERQRLWQQYVKIISQCKLPKRKKDRHEPRMITKLPTNFTVLHGSREKARKRSLDRETTKNQHF